MAIGTECQFYEEHVFIPGTVTCCCGTLKCTAHEEDHPWEDAKTGEPLTWEETQDYRLQEPRFHCPEHPDATFSRNEDGIINGCDDCLNGGDE